MNCGRQFKDVDMDKCYSMQVTDKESGFILAESCNETNAKFNELPARIYELNESDNCFQESIEPHDIGKPMKVFLTAHHEISIYPQFIDLPSFTEENYPTATL